MFDVKEEILDELDQAQEGSDKPFLEAPVITEAGLAHLRGLLEESKKELDRVIDRQDAIGSFSLSWYSLDDDKKRLTQYIQDLERFLAEYKRPPELTLYGVFEHTVEFIADLPDDEMPRVSIISRRIWSYLGEPTTILMTDIG